MGLNRNGLISPKSKGYQQQITSLEASQGPKCIFRQGTFLTSVKINNLRNQRLIKEAQKHFQRFKKA